MSVMLRGTKFHYRFLIHGVDFSGPCDGCTIQKGYTPDQINAVRLRALAFETSKRESLRKEAEEIHQTEEDIRKNRTVRALVENYRYELTGGHPITLQEALPLANAKPSRKKTTEKHLLFRKTHWDDFRTYMEDIYPSVKDLASVRRSHCETYVRYLVDHGRYVRNVSFIKKKKYRKAKIVSYQVDRKISSKTVKEIVGICKWVFNRLAEDAGVTFNPWENIILPAKDTIDREVFTRAELKLIWEGIQTNDFCRPLFMIAANSGLTEGDICCMKWADIDWTAGYLRTFRRKTGVRINLPLLPELVEYLQSLPRTSEYVLPEHAEMYLRQAPTVSLAVKNFLHGLGIVTTVKLEGRRAVSIKDLHSMRHVFCYRAKRAGIPESIIMKFVGHAVLSMTQHYADHDTDEELRAEIQKLQPLFFGTPKDDTSDRKELAALAYSLPIDRVRQLVRIAKNSSAQPDGLPAMPSPLCLPASHY